MIKKEAQRCSCTLGFVLWIPVPFCTLFLLGKKKSKWQSTVSCKYFIPPTQFFFFKTVAYSQLERQQSS